MRNPMALLLLAMLAGCATKGDRSLNPAALQMLSLGDSYTIGEAVAPSERWGVQLATTLRSEGLPISNSEIVAKTGWTTDELSAAIDERNLAGPYDLVTLLIGVNNQYRGRDQENYRNEFRALLDRSVGFAGGRPHRVVVLSIPDWGVTPFAEGRDRAKIAREIDAFNEVARQVVVERGAKWVDITPGSRRAAADPSLIARDGLHPSGRMYEEWARAALPVAREALSR
jgi:lysophospholipase L1-like esterase